MADDEKLRSALTNLSMASPLFYLIKFEDKRFPVVGSSFSNATFIMKYFGDEVESGVVS